MTVPDDKIQITILILRRGVLSSKDGNDSRGHCCKSQLDDGEEEHPDRYIINIRVYLRIEFRSLRLDSHTFCDSKHSICQPDD